MFDKGLNGRETVLGLGRSSDALCRDDVIDVDDLDSTDNKGKAEKAKMAANMLGSPWRSPVSCYMSQNSGTADATPISLSNRSHPGGICWWPFYPSACSLCQVTCSKLLGRSHITEQHNHTICLPKRMT